MLRAVCRIAGIVLVTLPMWLLYLLSRPLGWLAPRFGARSHFLLVRNWARVMATVMGIRIVRHGSPPRPPFFLVSNHLSYLDIIVYLASADAVLLSRADIARWPGIGILARTTGTLFIERARRRDLPKVLEQVQRRMDAGYGVVVFPEGTSSPGDEVLPFKASLFEAPAAAGMAVHCASVSYDVPSGARPARLAVAWWGDMTFADHAFRLLSLPGVRARLAFGEAPVHGSDRKELAANAEQTVRALFVPIGSGEPPAES